jgi:hypothetical protein
MARPTLEDFLSAGCRWHGTHRGIGYELAWHGQSDYNPQGTWCYYILVNSEQFYPDDWSKLRLEKEDKQYFGEGSFHRHYSYENFPDLDAHGGWTFGEMETYLGRDGKEHEQAKVGCDYAHAFDRDEGYWQGREAVERDAKHSIDLLCEQFPNRRERCGYSGKYDDADQFYTARNGKRIHKSQEAKLGEQGWKDWHPVDEPALASDLQSKR